jgi:hypothetical protein
MVTDADGNVAVRYYQNSPKTIQVNGRTYNFVFQNKYVTMAWVLPEDVDTVLAITHKCCPGSGPKHIFRLASQQEVNLWTGVGSVHP